MPTTTLLATPARRRMAALALSAGLFGLSNSAFDLVAPLWATSDLGLDAAGWAHLRGLRMFGTVAGALVLGVLAERLGARRTVAVGLALAGVALALMAGGGVLVMWAMPFFGALVSSSFVTFNALTQQVSDRRAGLANGIYRGVGAAMAIVAPLAATALAARLGTYQPVLLAGAFCLGLAGVAILVYPDRPGLERGRPLAEVLALFAKALRNRPLWAFIVADQTFALTQSAVAAFTALRLTRELHLGEPAFGVLFTIGAGLCLVATLVTGALVERFPLGRVMGLFWIVCAVASVVVGLGDSLVWSIAASLTLSVFWGITSVPGSLWLSRVGGANATTFTVHKIFQAGSMTAGMALVGWLEPIVGMRQLFFIGGLVGLPLALVMWRWRGP